MLDDNPQKQLFPNKTYCFYEVTSKRVMSYPEETRYGYMEVLENYKPDKKDVVIGKVIEVAMTTGKGTAILHYEIVGIEPDNRFDTTCYRVYVWPHQTAR